MNRILQYLGLVRKPIVLAEDWYQTWTLEELRTMEYLAKLKADAAPYWRQNLNSK